MPTEPDVRLAPPLRVPRVGLLANAAVASDLTGTRWGLRGAQWLPELHPTTSEAFGVRSLRCEPATVQHGSDDKATIEAAYPFEVYAFDWCSALEFNSRDWKGRARRALDAQQSFLIAEEFWDGAVAQADAALLGYENTYLANGPTVVSVAAMAPAKALALLDATVATQLRNSQGMIHCTVEVLNRLMSSDALRRDGDRWVTAFGNIVVADGGYSGNIDGQAANTEWMIASTPVEIVLGEVTLPEMNAASLYEVVDETVNDVVVWARRPALVMHEPHLLHHAAQVDLS